MIQMNDLTLQYKKLKLSIDKRIDDVLKHGRFIMGPEVYELEEKLAEYVGVKHAISCSSGTDALMLTLMAWEIGPGDAVFTTPFTFISTSEVITLLGATPVFVDIDKRTYNIDPKLLDKAVKQTLNEDKLTPKAVIPVDLFGLPADYQSIEKIALKYNIKVLEDAAQSFGSMYKEKRGGSFGDAGCTSFFPAKPLGCYGDGGAVFTDDTDLSDKVKSLRVHGKGSNKYDNVRTGINGRLDTIQGAILLAKLSVFDEELRLRNQVARDYSSELIDIVTVPEIPVGCTSVWAQYSVLAKDYDERKRIMHSLEDEGIKTSIYYQKPLHLQGVYKNLGYKIGDFHIAEEVSSRIFSLPMYPYLTNKKLGKIIKALKTIK
ncbi:DegT/DnrJ/EryC1/StrS family aminotransferase [Vallitalea sediminicola]